MQRRDHRHELDLRGDELSTDIVAHAIDRLDMLAAGETLALTVDRGEALDNDLRAWCEATGHHLLRVEDSGDARTYYIEKGVPLAVVHTLALVLSTDRHRYLAAPLSLAEAAALEGVGVSIFFEGDAVPLLTSRGRRARRFGRARAAAHDRLRRIHDLGGDLYACDRALTGRGLSREDFAFERVIRADYLTFLPVMEEADIQLLA